LLRLSLEGTKVMRNLLHRHRVVNGQNRFK